MAMQVLDSVTSTMAVGRELILSGKWQLDSTGKIEPPGVMARDQREGRGQPGRTWYGKPGESLYATYFAACGEDIPRFAGMLAFLAGVVVAERIDRLASGQATVGLKWPNDVLLNGKKVCGILIEMVKTADGPWIALIGTGVNLTTREFPSEIAQIATSVAAEGLTAPDWRELGEEIAAALQEALVRQRADPDLAPLLTRWSAFDQTVGRVYQTEIGGAVLTGTAQGISPEGALRLRLDDGRIIIVTSATGLREVG